VLCVYAVWIKCYIFTTTWNCLLLSFQKKRNSSLISALWGVYEHKRNINPFNKVRFLSAWILTFQCDFWRNLIDVIEVLVYAMHSWDFNIIVIPICVICFKIYSNPLEPDRLGCIAFTKNLDKVYC